MGDRAHLSLIKHQLGDRDRPQASVLSEEIKMKRLTYISKFADQLSDKDIEEIGRVSQKNNKRDNITGVLLCSGGFFYQIIEGDEDPVDRLYEKILKDERHTDILCLKSEENISDRLFPDWSMQTINLDRNTDLLIRPIRTMLQTIVESQRIIGKYTQSTILRMIEKGINPLEVIPYKTDRIIMFCDLMSFSSFTEKLPVEDVVFMVNQYFSICTRIITQYDGEVTKFIGDCVMAYFPADRADDALKASQEILQEMEVLRQSAPDNSYLKVLYCGIGLSKGTVIEGNLGSAVKKDYTILGDAVNVAERLESLTRELPYFTVLSKEVKQSVREDWDFIEIGTFQPKGKEDNVAVYSIADRAFFKGERDVPLSQEINDCLDRIAKQLVCSDR
jgi:class 3 adenylate cyclase